MKSIPVKKGSADDNIHRLLFSLDNGLKWKRDVWPLGVRNKGGRRVTLSLQKKVWIYKLGRVIHDRILDGLTSNHTLKHFSIYPLSQKTLHILLVAKVWTSGDGCSVFPRELSHSSHIDTGSQLNNKTHTAQLKPFEVLLHLVGNNAQEWHFWCFWMELYSRIHEKTQ